MSSLDDNFAIAAELEIHACVKIQSMLRLLQQFETTEITLVNPVVGGNVVEFVITPDGYFEDLDTCCRVKDVRRSNNTLEA